MLSGIVQNAEKRTEKPAMHGYMEVPSEIARLVIKNILIIEGVEPATKNPKFYLIATIVCLIFTIACVIWLITSIKTMGSYPIKLAGCIFAGAIGTIGGFVMFFRIVLGYEDKQNQKYYDESLQRMKDKSYVEKLISYGYKVSEKFR